MTFLCRLEATGGRPSGFDYLRLLLAVSVVVWHSFSVCYGEDWAKPVLLFGPFRPLGLFIVPSFFALSGFLVAGSLERNSLPAFMTLRALRIFPALTAEVVISAVIIGPLVTGMPLSDYFVQRKFFSYFLNVIGYIHFELPGVFSANPLPRLVNLQLWTVPFELECYIVLGALALFGLVAKRERLATVVVALTLFLQIKDMVIGPMIPIDTGGLGRVLICSFLFGVLFYIWRDRVQYSWLAFAAALACSWILLSDALYLASLPIAYATVFIGLQNWRRLFFIKGADYSYGVYLYGFPVQQMLIQFYPGHSWYLNSIASLLVAGLFAYISWTFLESKVMERKSGILLLVSGIETRFKLITLPRTRSTPR
jgi:peptidoglycan/LPS O-acetylase OafA/YrhL